MLNLLLLTVPIASFNLFVHRASYPGDQLDQVSLPDGNPSSGTQGLVLRATAGGNSLAIEGSIARGNNDNS